MKLIPPNITPGPWQRNIKPATQYPTVFAGRSTHVLHMTSHNPDVEANIEAVIALPQCLEFLAAEWNDANSRIESVADKLSCEHAEQYQRRARFSAPLLAAGYKIED